MTKNNKMEGNSKVSCPFKVSKSVWAGVSYSNLKIRDWFKSQIRHPISCNCWALEWVSEKTLVMMKIKQQTIFFIFHRSMLDWITPISMPPHPLSFLCSFLLTPTKGGCVKLERGFIWPPPSPFPSLAECHTHYLHSLPPSTQPTWPLSQPVNKKS